MATSGQIANLKAARQKKSFRTPGSDQQSRVKTALANAASRRAGGPNRFGSKGTVSGAGTGAAASFAANPKGKFIPRGPSTATGRPVGDGAGPPDRVLGGPGSKNGQPLRRGAFNKKS